jgi:fructose-bisphosphate aldolase class 1
MFDWMHRGKVERPLSEFHLEYMAAQKAKEESARHNLQRLKAEIASTVLPAIVALSKGDSVEVTKCINKLRQLSAV